MTVCLFISAAAGIVLFPSVSNASFPVRFERASSLEISLVKSAVGGETFCQPSISPISGKPQAAGTCGRGIVKAVQGGEAYFLVTTDINGDSGNFRIFKNNNRSLDEVHSKLGGEGAVYGYNAADFDGDGTEEIMVSYKTGGTSGNVAEIYRVMGEFKKMSGNELTYNAIDIADMPDADGKKDGRAEIAVGTRCRKGLSYEIYRLSGDKMIIAHNVYQYFFKKLARGLDDELSRRSAKKITDVKDKLRLAEAWAKAGSKSRALKIVMEIEKVLEKTPDDYSSREWLSEIRALIK
ncbi:MAG TPA: VCBS repeat-containing protein [Candidatus Wallbacteria bacterium]|nr:VCBS repeat-containing protein [Candidatus Wallbacteria bacterium]